jgi:hypothetical protein
MELQLKWVDALRIGFVGQFFGLIAFGVLGGDSLRAFYAARCGQQDEPPPNDSRGAQKKRGMTKQMGKAVASVFFDRVLGLLAMMGFAGLGFFFTDWTVIGNGDNANMLAALKSASLMMLIASAVGILGVFTMVNIPQLLAMKLYDSAMRIPWVGGLMGQLIKATLILRNRQGVIWLSFFLSIICNILIIVTIYAVAQFVGGNHPGLWEHWLIAPISMIANSVPLPGGLGGMEAVLNLQYQALSPVERGAETGIVVGFLFRFVLLLISATGAFLWLSMNSHERKKLAEDPVPSG